MKANGGPVKQVWNAGGEQNAAHEAEEKKKGGRVHGEGEKSKMRMDRPKRARGGRLRGEGMGADKSPLTTAAKVKHVTPGETGEDGADKVM
jgi:hypothetical protein